MKVPYFVVMKTSYYIVRIPHRQKDHESYMLMWSGGL